MPRACPCGTGEPLANCCGPLHDGRGSGRVTAATAEQLMRSRYTAFAVGHVTYLLASWHPSTRPDSLVLPDDLEWRRLEVLRTTAGGEQDDHGTVEFVAHHWDPTLLERGAQRETSTFVRERGQWFYVGATS